VTGDPVEVADVESGAHDLTFNVQGDTIAYARANDSSADESGVWLVATTGGEKRLALQNGDVDVDGATLTLDFSAPQFAPNINALLVRGQSGERIEYGVLDPAAGALVIVGQYDGMSWLADGRLLGYRSVVEGGALIAELNVIDPAIQPVEPVAILRAGDSMILTAKEVASGQVMVVFSDANFSGPARLRLAQVAVNQGEPDDIADIGFMDDPQISADGAFVAGILQASGRLLLFSPDDGLQMLTSPTNISDFLWATFR
jgi:hypothetical protein